MKREKIYISIKNNDIFGSSFNLKKEKSIFFGSHLHVGLDLNIQTLTVFFGCLDLAIRHFPSFLFISSLFHTWSSYLYIVTSSRFHIPIFQFLCGDIFPESLCLDIAAPSSFSSAPWKRKNRRTGDDLLEEVPCGKRLQLAIGAKA